MRSCLQCRAVTSREGGDMKSPLTLLYSHGRSFDDPHIHTQDSMIKRDLPLLLFSSFWFFSLVASVPFPRECGVESQAAASEIRLMASIRNSLLSSRVRFHLTSPSARFVLTWFRSNQWTIISTRIFYAPDNTHEDWPVCTLEKQNKTKKKRGKNCKKKVKTNK